jgi:hypothetical protein
MKPKYCLKLCKGAFMFILPLGIMVKTIKYKLTDSSGVILLYMNVVKKRNL